MAPYQFFLLLVGVLFIGVAAVAFNQAANADEPTPAHAIVDVAPATPTATALPDTIRL